MDRVLVAGAGNIGATIATFLAECGDYGVTLVDRDPEQLEPLAQKPNVEIKVADLALPESLLGLLDGQFAVLSALPFRLTLRIAEAAKRSRVHYLDLTEDVASARAAVALAEGSAKAFIPQCGLAPGFISIVGYDLAQRFDQLDTLKLRVGALPQFPSNALAYNLTWSTEGVINEYCEPCDAIVDGELIRVPALEQVERFALDGIAYEAFNTSGGLGSLCDTLAGRVRELNYRSIRYPGHRDIMKTLIRDLRLGDRRALLREVLENAVPMTLQDVVVIFASASGWKAGRLVQESYANKIYPRKIGGRIWAGIQVSTALAACAVLDLLRGKRIPDRGLVRQEQISLKDFLQNRFGSAFSQRDHHTAIPLSSTSRAA